mmetsp:Transcript_67342/g.217443  ORF Transcript_67342/g.217443 Transcript_67342/m.217443 type:complete len:255 (-) Transcript_67342:715-1479(-)
MDFERVLIVFSISATFADKPAFLSSSVAVEPSFLFISSMHQSRCSTSSLCWVCSNAAIFSMSSWTFSKTFNCTLVARSASPGEPALAAAAASKDAARWRRCCSFRVASAETCRNPIFTVLSKVSKEVSLLRILMASSTARISSFRLLTLALNSASLCEHFFSRSARKALSSSSCAFVFCPSFRARAYFSLLAACSSSSSVTTFLPELSSSSLATFNSWYSVSAFCSCARAFLRSPSKSSFICFSMPKTCPLCGV